MNLYCTTVTIWRKSVEGLEASGSQKWEASGSQSISIVSPFWQVFDDDNEDEGREASDSQEWEKNEEDSGLSRSNSKSVNGHKICICLPAFLRLPVC